MFTFSSYYIFMIMKNPFMHFMDVITSLFAYMGKKKKLNILGVSLILGASWINLATRCPMRKLVGGKTGDALWLWLKWFD